MTSEHPDVETDVEPVDTPDGVSTGSTSGGGPTSGSFGDAAAEMANETEIEGGEVDDPLTQLEKELAERTADLQRLQAEFLNYKRRVERDRDLVRENAVFAVLSPMLDVLDNIDRAREAGELEGGFKGVAEQLERIVTGLGLTRFGEPGDAFDPTLHEALSHVGTDPDVDVPTCKHIAKAGYRIGDRVVRAAQVLVVDPEPVSSRVSTSSTTGTERGRGVTRGQQRRLGQQGLLQGPGRRQGRRRRRRSRRRTASSRGRTTPTPSPATRLPRSASRRSPRPTTSSATPRSARSTTRCARCSAVGSPRRSGRLQLPRRLRVLGGRRRRCRRLRPLRPVRRPLRRRRRRWRRSGERTPRDPGRRPRDRGDDRLHRRGRGHHDLAAAVVGHRLRDLPGHRRQARHEAARLPDLRGSRHGDQQRWAAAFAMNETCPECHGRQVDLRRGLPDLPRFRARAVQPHAPGPHPGRASRTDSGSGSRARVPPATTAVPQATSSSPCTSATTRCSVARATTSP